MVLLIVIIMAVVLLGVVGLAWLTGANWWE